MIRVSELSKEDRDKREKIRLINEANLYRYKATFDTLLEFLHKDIDLYSASVEENHVSVRTETLEKFQKYICARITECDKASLGRKNKGNIF